MTDALRLTWRSLKDLWEEFSLLALLNLLWVGTVALAAVPLFALSRSGTVLIFALTLLCALPLPIASGALCFVTNQVTRGAAVGWATFAAGLRRYWAKSLLVALANGVVLLLVGANLRFYGLVLEGGWTAFALSAWLVLGLYWLLVQVFWFPMILELKSEKTLVALRHALALVIITPGFSLSVGLVLVLLTALSVALTIPAICFLAPLLLLLSNHATRSRLARLQKKPYKPGAGPD